jgi:hypothetical protein
MMPLPRVGSNQISAGAIAQSVCEMDGRKGLGAAIWWQSERRAPHIRIEFAEMDDW